MWSAEWRKRSWTEESCKWKTNTFEENVSQSDGRFAKSTPSYSRWLNVKCLEKGCLSLCFSFIWPPRSPSSPGWICSGLTDMLKRAKDRTNKTDFGNGLQSDLSGNVPFGRSPRERAALNDTAKIALWWGNGNVAPQWSVCMFGSRRLEQNAIKVIPAGAFSPYKKLRRMWVND